MPYEGVDERMDRLEAVLNSFIRHTDEGMAGLREGMAGLREGSAQLRDAMRQSQSEMAQFREKVDRDIAEMRQWRIESQKKWGELAQKLGSFVEDIVAPNIPRIAREEFRLGEESDELFSAPRIRMSHPGDASRMREFDYIFATKKGWIVVESKNDPKLRDVDDFRTTLSEVREYFPQYAPQPLYPIFASLNVPDHVVEYCSRHGIYALGLGPETMQLLNLADLPLNRPASQPGQ